MIEIRPFQKLGHANYGWLDAHYHFSFANYSDLNRMGWGNLRVWNDDTIAPQGGFPMHPHQDMEIITTVREGAITHKDSLGNVGRIQSGEVQVMSAGTGIIHSEYNLEAVPTRIFQIWIKPDRKGYTPSWKSRPFPSLNQKAAFDILASGFAEDKNALPIHAPARVLGAKIKKDQIVEYDLGNNALGYLVPAKGHVLIENVSIKERDGVALSATETVTIKALEDSELVFVQLNQSY